MRLMRSFFLALSRIEQLRHISLRFGPVRHMARRFVAGETLEEAMTTVRALNRDGLLATLDHLGENVSIDTHDSRLIDWTRGHARQRGISPDRFEFQMLYGIRSDLQRQLVAKGYQVRAYVPYGEHWYPYFMRRLAERPANVPLLLRNPFHA